MDTNSLREHLVKQLHVIAMAITASKLGPFVEPLDAQPIGIGGGRRQLRSLHELLAAMQPTRYLKRRELRLDITLCVHKVVH